MACATFSKIEVVDFSPLDAADAGYMEQLADAGSAWRLVLDKTSPADFWRIVQVYIQLEAKFGGKWPTKAQRAQALLHAWSNVWCECCEGCSGGCRGLLAAVLRASLACQECPRDTHACRDCKAMRCGDTGGDEADEAAAADPPAAASHQHQDHDLRRMRHHHHACTRQPDQAFLSRSGKRDFMAFAMQGQARVHPSLLPDRRLVIPTIRELHEAVLRLRSARLPAGSTPAGRQRGGSRLHAPRPADSNKEPVIITSRDLARHVLDVVDRRQWHGAAGAGAAASEAQAATRGVPSPDGLSDGSIQVLVIGQVQTRSGRVILADDTGEIGLVVPEEQLRRCGCGRARCRSAQVCAGIGLMDVVCLVSWQLVLNPSDLGVGAGAAGSRQPSSLTCSAPPAWQSHVLDILGEPYLQVCSLRSDRRACPRPREDLGDLGCGKGVRAPWPCSDPSVMGDGLRCLWRERPRGIRLAPLPLAAPRLAAATRRTAHVMIVQDIVPLPRQDPAHHKPGAVLVAGLLLVQGHGETAEGAGGEGAGGAGEGGAGGAANEGSPHWAAANILLEGSSAQGWPLLGLGSAFGVTGLGPQQHAACAQSRQRGQVERAACRAIARLATRLACLVAHAGPPCFSHRSGFATGGARRPGQS